MAFSGMQSHLPRPSGGKLQARTVLPWTRQGYDRQCDCRDLDDVERNCFGMSCPGEHFVIIEPILCCGRRLCPLSILLLRSIVCSAAVYGMGPALTMLPIDPVNYAATITAGVMIVSAIWYVLSARKYYYGPRQTIDVATLQRLESESIDDDRDDVKPPIEA